MADFYNDIAFGQVIDSQFLKRGDNLTVAFVDSIRTKSFHRFVTPVAAACPAIAGWPGPLRLFAQPDLEALCIQVDVNTQYRVHHLTIAAIAVLRKSSHEILKHARV